jgi:hypothetical protein
MSVYQGSPHIVKTGRLDFSLSWLKGEVRENLGDFRKSIQILTILSPLLHVPLPFTKWTCCTMILKRMQLRVWNKISNPVWVKFQEHGSSFYVYWRKSMIIGEKHPDLKRLTGQLKLRFLTEIGRFHWNQGKEVAHFVWFGEPWYIIQLMCN